MNFYKELVFLGNFSDGYEINTLQDILKDNDISYIKKQKGSGEFTKIITGFNPYGVDLYIHKDDLIRAKELIYGIFEQKE
ncbi:DUF2007 domain-containing protein [Clostridium sp. D2Q-11]|uniref:DUF2007 domain-containing protein n=1 Tax=Anaeromonas frigoriresistens TaxID=2683708 RepID=A0A942UX09_9FIRM|nr:DUF2007 domain-containing protein [Anaeromonas frigoriresistens]MBS4539125.1 DUF2007 domain-containing protein [Anaeromonas frigoriresistens]